MAVITFVLLSPPSSLYKGHISKLQDTKNSLERTLPNCKKNLKVVQIETLIQPPPVPNERLHHVSGGASSHFQQFSKSIALSNYKIVCHWSNKVCHIWNFRFMCCWCFWLFDLWSGGPLEHMRLVAWKL